MQKKTMKINDHSKNNEKQFTNAKLWSYLLSINPSVTTFGSHKDVIVPLSNLGNIDFYFGSILFYFSVFATTAISDRRAVTYLYCLSTRAVLFYDHFSFLELIRHVTSAEVSPLFC